MAQTKILIDTNSYFRLAQNIHPLLCQPFGAVDYTLYAHADLNSELRGVSRLKSKFHWVSDTSYVENRKRSLSLSKNNKSDIEDNYDYLWNYAQTEFHQIRGKGPGETDTLILATALALNIFVVTDDQDMRELAEEFEVKHMSSLELMKLMLDEKYLRIEQIHCVVEQWQYDRETPYQKWRAEYKKLFGETAPPLSLL